MRLAKRPNGVYIHFRDKDGRVKSECLTVNGVTPKKALKIAAEAFQARTRKAS